MQSAEPAMSQRAHVLNFSLIVAACGVVWLAAVGDAGALPASTPAAPSPLPVPYPNVQAKAIVTGDLFTCVLSTMGGVKCWGWNQDGELGDGTTTARPSPVQVYGFSSGVTAIAAAKRFACALMSTG